MVNLVSKPLFGCSYFPAFDEENPVSDLLQSQLRNKLETVINEAKLSFDDISAQTGISKDKLELMLSGALRISLSDFNAVLDTLGYFDEENALLNPFVK